jgi:hypothetical protein
MCPLSHSYLYCYRFIVIHQSGTRKALFGPGLNNTKVYLNSFVVLLNIIQLQDKVFIICYLDLEENITNVIVCFWLLLLKVLINFH